MIKLNRNLPRKERIKQILGRQLPKRRWPDTVLAARLGFPYGEVRKIRIMLGIEKAPHPKTRRISENDTRRVIELYRQGNTADTLSRQYRIHIETLKKILTEKGILVREPKKRNKGFDFDGLVKKIKGKCRKKSRTEVMRLYAKTMMQIREIQPVLEEMKMDRPLEKYIKDKKVERTLNRLRALLAVQEATAEVLSKKLWKKT